MKYLFRILLLLSLATCCFAQSTTLSGTVTDLGAQTWNNGTFNFQFVGNPNAGGPYTWTGGTLPTNIAGVLNGSGAYSVSIPSNTAITPGGTMWRGTFCPQATSPCYTASQIIVTGATMTFNVTPPAIAISLINPPPGPTLAYSDVEISSAAIGSFYYNLASQGYRVCQAVNASQACTSFAPIASGGSGSAFSAITSGTNAIAAMVVGTGASLTTSGSGTIAATTATTASAVPFAGVTTGTNTTPLLIGTGGSLAASGSGTITATTVPFSGVTAGTNAAALVVGTGGILTISGSGTINATAINGVTITGTPTAGQAPIAQSATTATWGSILPFYQTWQNNGSAIPQQPITNAVPPLVIANNIANGRSDLSVTPCQAGATHSAGILGDPGVTPNLSAFWRSDCTLAIPAAAGSSVKPDPTSGIQYVAKTCSGGVACVDTNDGLSVGTAKLTPYAALLALPNGSASPPTAGNGAVYVANDLNGIAFGGPVANQGWWMFGPSDPNYTAGLSGWMRVPTVGTVTLECIAPTASIIHVWGGQCQEFWGGHTDNVHPAIWFDGFSGQAVLRGFGFNFESNPIKLGIDSNNNRGTTGVSSVWLDRINVNMGSCYSGIGAGPGLDIGGNSFWIGITNSSFTGCITQDYTATAVRTSNVVTLTLNQSGTGDIVANNQYIIVRNMSDPSFNGGFLMTSASGTSVTYAQNGPNASATGGNVFPYGAAAIGINSSDISGSAVGGAGFVYANTNAVNDGGIWAAGGFNGVGLSVSQLIYEGNFTNVDMATVELLPTIKNSDTFVTINDVQTADQTVNICGVESLGIGFNVSAQNTTVCGNLVSANNNGSPYVASPLRQGTFGLYGKQHIAANIDDGRRLFSPSAVRFSNGVSTNSSGWTTQAGVTFTSGQLAPDGTTGAVLVTNSTGGTLSINFGGQFSATPQLNSNYMFGVWLRSATPSIGANAIGPNLNLNSSGLGSGNFCAGPYLSGSGVTSITSNVAVPTIFGDGEWEYYSGLCKIITNPSSGNQRFDMNVAANSSIVVYAPVFLIAPAGSMSDNEAWELANNLQSYPSAAAAGDISMIPGQRFAMAVPGGSQFLYFHTGSPTANRTLTWPDASGIVPLFNGAITATTNVCTFGTNGQITTIGCPSGGGGSGNITNAPQFSCAYYSSPGTANFISGCTPPTTPTGVAQYEIEIPAAGPVAAAPQFALPGVPGRTVTGASDTWLVTDRVAREKYTNAGATAISVPGPGTAGFGSNFCSRIKVQGAGASDVLTPTAGTINGNSSLTVLQGQAGLVCSFDNINFEADIFESGGLVAGTNITFGRSDFGGLTINSTAGGGTVTNVATLLTSGQLLVGNTYPDIKVGNLSGDATTAGSTVVTVPRVNGVSYPASPATNTVPLVTAANTVTYTSSTTTINGQACAIGSTCNVNAGSTVHGVAINEGNGAAIASSAVGVQNAIFSGVASADPTFKSLSDLSAETYAGTATGAVNVLAACPTRAATALTTGMTSFFLPNLANTGAPTNPTYNLCTLGAKNITKHGTANLSNSDLTTIAIAEVRYDGTEWQLQNPQTEGGSGATSISSLLGAAASNSILNANFAQTWQWALASNGSSGAIVSGLTLNESAASTTGTITTNLDNQSIFQVATLAGSTATPLAVQQGSLSGTSAYPFAQFSSTWNNAATIYQGMVISVTNTASSGSSKLLAMYGGSAGTTAEFSVLGDGSALIGASLKATGTSYSSSVGTTSVTFQGGTDGSSTGTQGTGIFRGASNSNTGAAAIAGSALLLGGPESGATGTTTAGSALINSGAATSATGTQGVTQIASQMLGTGLTTLQAVCMGTVSFTVVSCGTTAPFNFVGVAMSTGTPVPTVMYGLAPMIATAAVTIGDTACLSAITANQITDSGGKSACANPPTFLIVATSGTVRVLDTTGASQSTVTLSTTQPLVRLP